MEKDETPSYDFADYHGNIGQKGRGRMHSVEQATGELVEAILESSVYQTYQAELERVKAIPGLKEQIDEFRRRNYELQTSEDIDFYKLDCIEKEYSEFRKQPVVEEFLAAELELCRMIQNITGRITEGLRFE